MRLSRALAGCTLPVFATIALLSAAQANDQANPCGNTISILNEGKNYEAFDRQNGGGEKRLRFRLDGKEPCPAGECKAEAKVEAKEDAKDESKPETRVDGKAETRPEPGPEIKAATKIEIVAGAAEKVIATIDLKDRSASYCVYELSRVDLKPDPRRTGCPRSYLRNFLAIKLVDGDGPFARRDVSIQYLYRADASAASLDNCTTPLVLDGMFRRRAWTVPLDDGAAALIGEVDFPRDRRSPVPQDAPYATAVFGARE